MTLPEALLWRELKKRPDGLKFRHQHPAGPYSLDFFCYEASLAIEVDGEIHGRGDQPERDAIRDAWLAQQNVHVLRINASDVLRDMEAVVRHIVATARG
ncbi:MAG: endonuclease domain-containing protein [Sphingomonas sp.]